MNVRRMKCGSDICEPTFKCCTSVQGHSVAYTNGSSYCCHPDHYNLMMIISSTVFILFFVGICTCLGWAYIKKRKNKRRREKHVRRNEDNLPSYDEIHTKSTSLPGYQPNNVPGYQPDSAPEYKPQNLPGYENKAYSSTENL